MDKRKLIMSVIIKHRSHIIETIGFRYFKTLIGFYFEPVRYSRTRRLGPVIDHDEKLTIIIHECLLTKHARNEVLHTGRRKYIIQTNRP